MNVYDFDKTIYNGDSSVDFYIFTLKKNPKILKHLPKQIFSIILYKLKRIDKTKMKEEFFSFLQDINVESTLDEFWSIKEKKIKKWYIEQKREDDLIISASPEFLLRPICKKLGIKNLIASKVNKKTGKFEDENCKGAKKLELFNKEYKNKQIDNFYSDSISDKPLADTSHKAYLVRKDNILDWPQNTNKIKLIMKGYLLMFCALMLVYCSINYPRPVGEWDDYSLPVVSIIKQHNFSIDANDIEEAKKLFPDWANFIEHYNLSGYKTRNGGEMSWYFPIYSIACVPAVLALRLLRIPTTYAFAYTNLASLMVLLLFIYKYLKVSDKRKFAIILLFSINPIIFYLTWISAEVLIFALIGIAVACWYNKWYKRAALVISIAGMLNPTILCFGIIMIIDYIVQLLKNRKHNEKFIGFVKQNIGKIISYGGCYLIALIPFAYNYYNTGHINLTASLSSFTQAEETTFARFLAYLFDLNFGFLPYFSILFVLVLVLIPLAIYRKQWNYIKLMVAFFINVYLYSIMIHINSGMSGIARYNVWAAVYMIFAIGIYFDKIIKDKALVVIIKFMLMLSTILTGTIIFKYGPMRSANADYLHITPITSIVLDNMPEIYNPLHSTFNSRVNHVDGEYTYSTPIVYRNPKGHVKKILATSKDTEEILEKYIVVSGDEAWLKNEMSKLSDEETYISVPRNYIIVEKNDK